MRINIINNISEHKEQRQSNNRYDQISKQNKKNVDNASFYEILKKKLK